MLHPGHSELSERNKKARVSALAAALVKVSATAGNAVRGPFDLGMDDCPGTACICTTFPQMVIERRRILPPS
jgi:hypothetical protein